MLLKDIFDNTSVMYDNNWMLSGDKSFGALGDEGGGDWDKSGKAKV